MDNAALVAPDFRAGLELVQALDKSGPPISVALWLYASDYEDWRFVLASRQLDAVDRPDAYGWVHDALAAAGIPLEQTPPLLILKMSDRMIRELRRIFSKTKTVEGMRLGGRLIGDQFVQEALVYRIR